MKKILIADDEELIRRLVVDFFKKDGYEMIEAADGQEALDLFNKYEDSLSAVILDIMMPNVDGWEVCRRIRKNSQIPVLMLTARSQEFDELTAFEAGADDYVTKPFSPSVLVKRIEALIRRNERAAVTSEAIFTIDGLTIDDTAHEVTLDGKVVTLTLKEYSVLFKLISNAGKVFSRESLLDDIWGFDFYGDIRTVDSHMARLRTKLGDWGAAHIKTIYGAGYKLEVKPNEKDGES